MKKNKCLIFLTKVVNQNNKNNYIFSNNVKEREINIIYKIITK